MPKQQKAIGKLGTFVENKKYIEKKSSMRNKKKGKNEVELAEISDGLKTLFD